MQERTFDPFVEQDMMEFEDLEKRLNETNYIDGINVQARKVLYEFMMYVSGDTYEGVGLVQTWMTAIKEIGTNEYQGYEFPTTKSGLPLFPLVLGLMDLKPDVFSSALAVYEVLDPRFKRQPTT